MFTPVDARAARRPTPNTQYHLNVLHVSLPDMGAVDTQVFAVRPLTLISQVPHSPFLHEYLRGEES